MEFEYPGQYNFGGLTTDAEIANLVNFRQARALRAREDRVRETVIDDPVIVESQSPQQEVLLPKPEQKEIITPTSAMIALLNSQPVTALDWIVIIIILISFACLIQKIAKYGHKSHKSRFVD
jgi:hypothetical protein